MDRKVQRLPTPRRNIDIHGPRTQTMTVQQFITYMSRPVKSVKNEDHLWYWSSQVLHEPPFDSLLPTFTRPHPFRASDDFLTRWRCLRLVAPSLLQFIFYFRWLFLGPAGAYSRLHVDPAGSAAWNACLEGTKRFVFFDPLVMHDLHEDLSNPAAGKHLFPEYLADKGAIKHAGLEIIASAGDVVYAPPRWPHFVENLEASVSVTENFIRPDQHCFLDEALGSVEACSGIPRDEVRRLQRFRRFVNLAFSLDQMLGSTQAKQRGKNAQSTCVQDHKDVLCIAATAELCGYSVQ